MASFLSKLNLLIVDCIDVLDRCMTLLETAWDWSTDWVGDGGFFLGSGTRFGFEGFEKGCCSWVENLLNGLSVFWFSGGVQIDVELDTVAREALGSVHLFG